MRPVPVQILVALPSSPAASVLGSGWVTLMRALSALSALCDALLQRVSTRVCVSACNCACKCVCVRARGVVHAFVHNRDGLFAYLSSPARK